MDILIFIVLGALGVILLVAGIAGAMMLKRQKEKGMVARALNMTLFSVRLPRESPKEGQQNKQGKELLAVMEQLYSSFNNFRSTGWNSMLYGGPYLSFEIAVHNIGEEIHFYVSAPKRYANTVEKQILGLYPSAEVNMVKDYNIFNPHGGTAASYMRLLRNPLLPIRTYSKLEADPLGEVLTAMSKLKEKGEGAALQVLLRPSQNAKMKKLAMKVSKEIKMGKGFGDALKKAGEHEVAKIGREMFLEITGLKVQQTPGQPLTPAQTAQQTATPYHEELVKAVSEKFSKPAFDVDIRLVASGADDARASEILHEVESAFVQFGSPDLNAFSASRISGPRLKKLIFDFSFRMFNDAESMYLSTEEVASVYHFPTVLTAAPRVKFLKAKSAEPPSDLPSEGIILGKNSYRGQDVLVRMDRVDRRRHLYVVGQTGTGKSTFIHSLIKQDIEAGEGVAVIDPHGELVDDVLSIIPQNRMEDVILFNPGDIQRPMGLNILEIDPSQPQQKSFVIDDFFKTLKMIYKDQPEAFGPIFEKFFKNTIMLLLDDYENEIPTIADISRVFADKNYRELKLSRETNPEIVRFWRFEAEKMSGDWSLPNMSGYITSKFAPFILNEYVRPIITQQKSSFNFRDVMDNKKILLVNLSKGLIGDLNAGLLGLVVVSKILVSAFSRVDIDPEQRKDFYLYIDEFQNFTTDSIATILSEARKYKLNLILAHQFIKQLQDNIKNAVFGNVGSTVAFRVSEEDAEFLKMKFEPVFSPNDLANIDNFNAYAKLLIHNETARPFNIQVIKADNGDQERAKAIRELSRLKYGRDRAEVEREFRERQEATASISAPPSVSQ